MSRGSARSSSVRAAQYWRAQARHSRSGLISLHVQHLVCGSMGATCGGECVNCKGQTPESKRRNCGDYARATRGKSPRGVTLVAVLQAGAAERHRRGHGVAGLHVQHAGHDVRRAAAAT